MIVSRSDFRVIVTEVARRTRQPENARCSICRQWIVLRGRFAGPDAIDRRTARMAGEI